MSRMLVIAVALALATALVGCGDAIEISSPTEDDVEGEPIPVEPDEGIGDGAGPPGEAQEITGTFGGDAELEGGCVWLDGDDGTRYEVQWPEGYEPAFDPVSLIGPDGEVVAEAGDELTVRGSADPDMMSFCQVGTMFSATDVES